MDRLVVDGDKIEEYVIIVTKKINEFIEVVHNIDNEKKNIVWVSENSNIMMLNYDNMIRDYISYTERMLKLIDYLNKLINRYDESLLDIKKEYLKLKDEYNIEVYDE